MSYYDLYGRMANQGMPSTIQNGRYEIQQHAEKNIPADVFKKLMLNKNDELLDIGCGMGINVIPATSVVKKAHACDHPDILKKIPEINGITKHPGNFMDVEFSQKFSKILTYSVLHCLPNEATILLFIDKILSLLSPSGVALLGDIPNIDMKKRFLESKRGIIFQKKWEDQQKNSSTPLTSTSRPIEGKPDSAVINDDMMMRFIDHIRKAGFHAYSVPQPQNLPFGNTREDILIFGTEYSDESCA